MTIVIRSDLPEQEQWFDHPFIWENSSRSGGLHAKETRGVRFYDRDKSMEYIRSHVSQKINPESLDKETPETIAFIRNEIEMLRAAIGLPDMKRESPFEEVACDRCEMIETSPHRKRMHSSQYHGSLPYGDGEDV